MSLENVLYVLAGMGVLALLGLIPIVGSVVWFIKNFATVEYVDKSVLVVSKRQDQMSEVQEEHGEQIQNGKLQHVEMMGLLRSLKDAVIGLTSRLDKLPMARTCPTCSVASDHPGGHHK